MSMERLTKKLPDGRNILRGNFAYVRNPKYGSFVEGYAVDKLADYEDAEEQGLLLRLPCKIGDTVYKLWYKPCHNGEDYPDSYYCCGCEDECDLKRDIFNFTVPSLGWILQHFGRFGDGVWYLKREEAEQALKRMESE